MTWLGSSRADLKRFPQQVRRDVGKALYAAQHGETDPAARPLKGFGGARVIATPKPEIDLIRRRLADAQRLHRERQH